MCESRPSQGQAEPLFYPLLPCVPPGFCPPPSPPPASPFSLSPHPHPPRHSSDFFKSVLLWRIPLLLVLLLLEETKTGWKNSHHLLLRELLTMQIPSLSSSALSSLFLPPSLPPCYCWCSVLSHFLFLLPLSRPSSNSNSYLVSHFSTCSDTG